jgi:hypothetical protein
MSDDEDSSGEYEVEEILDKRIVKGFTQYFVQWKGYSAGELLSNTAT